MAYQTINVGAAANDGTGDVGPRVWLQRLLANDTELYGGGATPAFFFNVKMLGAVGDGITDDTVALQAALTAAAAVNGQVYIPHGTYKITTTLTVGSNILIAGDGRGSKIITGTLAIDVFTLTGVSNTTIQDLYGVGNSRDHQDTAPHHSFVNFTASCNNITILGCFIERFDEAIFGGDSQQITVMNCSFTANSGAGSRWLTVTNSAFANNQYDGTRTGIGNGVAGGNMVWLSSSSSPSTPCANCVISGNTSKNTSFEGILIIATKCTVVGNVVDTAALNGITLQSSSGESVQPVVGGTYNTVTGNSLRNIATDNAAIRIGHSSGNNTVAGHHNIISGNLVDSSSWGCTMDQDAADNLITGNHFNLNGLGTNSHGIGMAVQANRNHVQGNYVAGAVLHGCLIQGGTGHTVRHNVFYKNVQSGILLNGTPVDTLIEGNICQDNDALTTGAGQGITVVSGTRTAIIGNKCFCSNPANFQQRGINISSSTPTGTVLIGNDCRNNRLTTGGINNQDLTGWEVGNLGGNQSRQAKGIFPLTYGPTVNTDVATGDLFHVIATNGTAFTIANPTNLGTTNLQEGQEITYLIDNNSGGALGAVTWGTDFNLAGVFTNPANGQLRTISFVRRTSKWRETNRSAADQAR